MTKTDFIHKLVSYPNVEIIDFNSYNGWGFGGAIGKRYLIDGLTVTIATACYRHAPSEDFIRLDKPEQYGYLDVTPTPKGMESIINIIDRHLKNNK